MTRIAPLPLALVLSAFSLGCAPEAPLAAADPFVGPAPTERAPQDADRARRSANLRLSASAPAATGGGDTETVSFLVENDGSQKARSVELVVDLPTEGSLASLDSACVVTGTEAVCDLGNLSAGSSAQVDIDWTAPDATTVLDLDGEVSSRSSESSTADNVDGVSISVTQPTLVVAGGETFYLTGCMSSVPVTFADCGTLAPLYYEPLTLNSDNTITANTTANGFWQQPNAHSIELLFAEQGTNVLLSYFQAEALDADCFDGIVVYSQAAAFGAFRMCQSGYPSP
jgi:hypothetical protein